MPSKVAYIDSYDSLGTNAIAISYQDVVRYEITDPYLRLAVYGATELVDRSIPGEGTSSWIHASHSGVVNRLGQVRTSAVPNRRKALLRSGERALH